MTKALTRRTTERLEAVGCWQTVWHHKSEKDDDRGIYLTVILCEAV